MKRKWFWILSVVAIVVVLVFAVLALAACTGIPQPPSRDPQDHLPIHPTHTDHTDIIKGPFDSPQAVTQACLECHPDSADQVMHTTHWTWESQPITVPWRSEPVTIGKKNQINNFCIGIQGNQKLCTSCHVGYGWEDNATFDFQNGQNVDCLVCHADTTTYAKSNFGYPAEGIDLLAAAKSVRAPNRDNCGKCHFDGGGGNNVKHGDLDESLRFPSAAQDVHMGEHNMICTDCHTTDDHQIKGKLLADNFTIAPDSQVACTDCHPKDLHEDERINAHVDTVACQTCHIPDIATKNPTKTFWDWSTAGQDLPEDHYSYLKIKGSFVYTTDVQPTLAWSNGNLAYRYLLGDKIDPTTVTVLNQPAGDIKDPTAKITPFKIHLANQPYDVKNKVLLQPITAGEGGFWQNFNWDQAFRLAEQYTGVAYSGEYSFIETSMYWPTTHMVQPAEKALQCDDCHATAGQPDPGRIDWKALGYPGDPMEWGGRFSKQ